MTEQEQIEEMAKDLKQIKFNMQGYFIPQYVGVHEDITARYLYDLGYRKIPENAVVLTREEYTNYMVEYMGVKEIKDRVRMEIAKEIWDIVMSDECSVEGTFDDTKFTQIIKERYGVDVEE